MTQPRWDPTINLGHLVSFIGFIFALGGGWYLTDYRLSALERNFEKLSTVVIDNARIDERLKDVGRRLERLETGR